MNNRAIRPKSLDPSVRAGGGVGLLPNGKFVLLAFIQRLVGFLLGFLRGLLASAWKEAGVRKKENRSTSLGHSCRAYELPVLVMFALAGLHVITLQVVLPP